MIVYSNNLLFLRRMLRKTIMSTIRKPGRNDPCPCGSGKKFKKCCLLTTSANTSSLTLPKMRRTEGLLVDKIALFAENHYGTELFRLAWEEYNLWQDDLPDELDEIDELEINTVFMPWFVFNWIPEMDELGSEFDNVEEPLAILYLQNKKNKLDSFQQRFIEEICSQPYSFFVVEQVEPGERLFLRDVILQRTVCVLERQASNSLKEGDILFSRIMSMDDVSIMVGCAPIIIGPLYYVNILEMRDELIGILGELGRTDLLEDDLTLRELYFNIRNESRQPARPQLCNTDGDLLELVELHFELNCTPDEALQALRTLSFGDEVDLMSTAKYNTDGELVAIDFPWFKQANRKIISPNNVVLGRIFIDANKLSIEVNSHERSEEIQRKLKRRLGKRIVYKNAVIQSMQKMAQDMQNDPVPFSHEHGMESEAELFDSPEFAEVKKNYYDDYWKSWYTTPIPALKNQTPREASKTSQGRELLQALLQEYEQGFEVNPMSAFLYADLSSVRTKLKL